MKVKSSSKKLWKYGDLNTVSHWFQVLGLIICMAHGYALCSWSPEASLLFRWWFLLVEIFFENAARCVLRKEDRLNLNPQNFSSRKLKSYRDWYPLFPVEWCSWWAAGWAGHTRTSRRSRTDGDSFLRKTTMVNSEWCQVQLCRWLDLMNFSKQSIGVRWWPSFY